MYTFLHILFLCSLFICFRVSTFYIIRNLVGVFVLLKSWDYGIGLTYTYFIIILLCIVSITRFYIASLHYLFLQKISFFYVILKSIFLKSMFTLSITNV